MKNWEDLALETTEQFGGTMPHPDTATQIAQAYARAPHAVLKAIDKIATEYQDGSIRSPWGVLRSRVKQISTSEHTTHRADGREKAIGRAEQWLRTAGLHYDRWSEVHDDLFGERGRIQQHHTPQLEQQLLALWTELRPMGELVEAEAIERGIRYQQHRAAQKPANAATTIQETE